MSKTENSLQVSIVMPCLNEAETLATCIQKAFLSLQTAGIAGEVIIADNGSTDGSQQIARDLNARLVDVPVRGYGAALAAGIAAAEAPYVLMADADDSYEFNHIPRFLTELQKGNDLVMGNRFRGGIEPGAMPFLHRYLGNPVLSLMGRLWFGVNARDFHCGIRAFRKQAYEQLDMRTTGMEFASEMVVKAGLLGLRIAEVPTTLKPDGRSRKPHLRTWRDGWRHLRFMLMYSPRWLFLYPGLLFMLVGIAITTLLIPGQRSLGGVRFDVDTMVYALALVLIGFHAVVFWFSARVFAITEGFGREPAWYGKVFRYFSLETGLAAGIVLFLVSASAAAMAVHSWSKAGFGPLIADRMLRLTLPSSAGLVLGAEICFTSFFLSMLGTKRR